MPRTLLVGTICFWAVASGTSAQPGEPGSSPADRIGKLGPTVSVDNLGPLSTSKAIQKYEQLLPPGQKANYYRLRTFLLRRSFTDLYIIKFFSEGQLCQSVDCFGNPPTLVQTVAESIIQGRKDEETERSAVSNARNSTIASVSAMLSAILSCATLFFTLRRADRCG